MKEKFIKGTKIILINGFSLFIFLIFVDRLIPLITKQKSGTERYANIREHNPFSSYIVESDTTKVYINTDENGFILGNIKPIIQGIDYIFLGGSTTECFYVDEDKRFPFLSIQLFNKLNNEKFYGFNAGFGGSNLYHSYIILITKLLDLKPKNIVLMNAVNDYSYLRNFGTYFKGGKSILNKNENSIYSIFKKSKDLLFPNLYRSLRSIFKISQLGLIPGGPDISSKNEFSNEKNLIQYSKALDLFIETCRIYNINLILMTQFNNLQNLSSKQLTEYRLFNQEIRRKANSKNLSLIDLDSLVPKNFETMYDGIHLTNKGSLLVSEIISDHLSSLK